MNRKNSTQLHTKNKNNNKSSLELIWEIGSLQNIFINLVNTNNLKFFV